MYRRGTEEFSVLYDVTEDKLDSKVFHNKARMAFPIGTHRENGRIIVELILKLVSKLVLHRLPFPI